MTAAILEAAIVAALADGEPLDPGAVEAWAAAEPQAAPFARIARGFVLDPAEAGLIALLHGAALSEPVTAALHALTRDNRRGLPLWLAQRLLPGLAATSLAADAALRRFALVECESATPRIDSRVWLSEALFDRLCGVPPRELALAARFTPLAPDPELAAPELAAELGEALRPNEAGALPPVLLAGSLEPEMVAAGLARLGLRPFLLRAADLPAEAEARETLAAAWSRDAAIDGAALVLDAGESQGPLAAGFADRVTGHVVVTGPALLPRDMRAQRAIGTAAAVPGTIERWQLTLGPARAALLGPALARVAAQFRLAPAEIEAVAARVAPELDRGDPAEAARQLWHHAARAHQPQVLAGVTIAEPIYDWRDIVLPPSLEDGLRRVESHVRHAAHVFDGWGFERAMGGRGRGVAALFSGPSGTGKTMAAEVLASALDLRVMTVDLGQLISKFVGETSKHIAAAFDAAERTGAVMVWNEGDAIWGARGEVGHATDRLVNAEVGDLLQRIESFRGFTVVTTNMRQAIDPAFLRRFRFALDFPMPGTLERVRLWERAFPPRAPLVPVDWTCLGDLRLSGGSIRAIALGAAFLAAGAGSAITHELIEREIAEELRKQGQPMPRIQWREPPAGLEAAE